MSQVHEHDPVLDDGPGEEYSGAADVDGTVVTVDLRGHFEPIDGKFHWYGRIATSEALSSQHQSGDNVVVTTPHGSARGRLSDVDPWGRYRISGTGRPPF